MKRKPIVLAALLTVTQAGWAGPVDLQEANNIAQRFLGNGKTTLRQVKGTDNGNTLRLAYTGTSSQSASDDGNALYYVFNREGGNGFIIIAGDDRAKPVLGYADSGSFEPVNLPDNFRHWLESCREQLDALARTPEAANTRTAEAAAETANDGYAEYVAPLLGDINYNQNAPYNNLCPIDRSTQQRSVTGCVATAMAQIMAYHQWPKQGTGSHSYTTYTRRMSVSADFSQTTYDWDNILPYYDGTSETARQQEAIATLMFHCGAAVEMDYTSNASGAVVTQIAQALYDYFGYDGTLQDHYREYYTEAEWKALIKKELNEGRPILYGGASSVTNAQGGIDRGAHEYCCDGYDANGLFHINWGWGGVSNGYFELDVLNPGTQGIGGSAGGYTQIQSIITGIQPAKGTQTPLQPMLLLSEGLSYDGTEISFGVANMGTGSCEVAIGIGIYQDETLQRAVPVTGDLQIPGSGYGLTPGWQPTGMQEGDLVRPVYRTAGTDEWLPIQAAVGMIDRLAFIEGQYLYNRTTIPGLTVTGVEVNGAYQARSAQLRFTVSNEGVEYNRTILAYVMKKDDYESLGSGQSIFGISSRIGQEGIVVGADESKEYTLDLPNMAALTQGDYYLYFLYELTRGRMSVCPLSATDNVEGMFFPFTVKGTPAAPSLTMTGLRTTSGNTTFHTDEQLEVSATIKNTGGYENVRVTGGIVVKGGNNIVAQFPDILSVPLENGESQTVTLQMPLDGLEPGAYQAYLFYYDSWSDSGSPVWTNWVNNVAFTLLEAGSSGIDGQETGNFSYYPTPVTDRLYLSSGQVIRQVRILLPTGATVATAVPQATEAVLETGRLAPGIYLIQVETETGTETRKFMKR